VAPRGEASGFTVLELAITVVLLLVLSGTVLQTLESMKRMALVGNVRAQAQRDAQRAIETMVEDLRRAGLVELGGLEFPHFILNGTPAPGYDPDELHTHEPANKQAVAGDFDFGENIGLLFVHPALWPNEVLAADPAQAQRWPYGRPLVTTDTEVYGPGQPVDSANADFAVADGSALVWNRANTISYTLRTDLTGRNVLMRRETNGALRALARNVERIDFQDAEDLANTIPFNALRVRIFFRVPDERGQIHRFHMEATVRLRNGTGI